jgi:hypothetical protein
MIATVAQPAEAPASENAPRLGLCLDCGYALHGLPTPRCPECGREFDPFDPATMNMGRALSPLAQWVLGPVSWPVNLLTWAALGFALWTARLPGGQIRGSSSIVILISLGCLWLAWPIVRVIAARKHGWPHSLLMQEQRQRAAVGLCLLAASVSIFYHAPMKVALYFSRDDMDAMAIKLMSSGEPFADDQWLGVYRATRIKTIQGGVRFTCEEQNRAYKSGFMYLPDYNPKRWQSRRRSFVYVGGSWWAWREEG